MKFVNEEETFSNIHSLDQSTTKVNRFSNINVLCILSPSSYENIWNNLHVRNTPVYPKKMKGLIYRNVNAMNAKNSADTL